MTRWFLVHTRLIATRAASLAIATSPAASTVFLWVSTDVICATVQLVASRKHSIVGKSVIAWITVSNVVFVVLRGFFVLRNRYFSQIARVLVIVTMRSVAHYVFVICMALIRCHCAVIMILWLLWRMLLELLIAVLIVLSVMMFSLLFSFIIVIASTMIKMGMIMSLLPLHWTAIRWAFVNWVIVRAIHHRLRAERSKARIVKRRGGGLLRAVGKGVVAVAQSVRRICI